MQAFKNWLQSIKRWILALISPATPGGASTPGAAPIASPAPASQAGLVSPAAPVMVWPFDGQTLGDVRTALQAAGYSWELVDQSAFIRGQRNPLDPIALAWAAKVTNPATYAQTEQERNDAKALLRWHLGGFAKLHPTWTREQILAWNREAGDSTSSGWTHGG